ncbi:MAG: DedA family protein [Isosphaeraceae bacterium]|nr:DedA family protein [Isosphaeraceae bacterium]
MLELFQNVVHTLLHLSPETMNDLAHSMGPGLYVVLIGIIFAETGLVALPFLPGDSLLFAVGAVAAHPSSGINLGLMAVLLIVAAVAGDAVNYAIGYRLGPKVFSREDSWLLNKKHLVEAQQFYEQYGAKTIVIARFMPIVRTFAPFVAGIGRMNYGRFALFNVTGGVAWVLSFLLAGWWFGGREVIQKNFKLVIIAIIAISVLPAFVEFLRKRGKRPRVGEGALEATPLGEPAD